MSAWGRVRDAVGSLAGLVRGAVRAGAGRHSAWMVGGTGVQAGVAFLANLALVRLLTPTDFGRFAIVQANISIIGALFDLRVGPLILQTPEEELDRELLGRYTGAVAFENVMVGSGALLVLWLVDLLSLGAGILLAASLASTWVTAQVRLYERRFEYQRLTVLETVASAGGHVAAVLGALGGLGALVLYARTAVELTALVAGLAWVGALRRFPLRWLTTEDWKALFRRVRGYWADGLLARSFDRVVILLVGGLASEQAAGYFFQAHRLAVVPNRLLSPINARISFNYFSHRIPPERRPSVLRRALVLMGGALALVGVVAGVLADPVIPWLFGPGWGPVVPIFVAMVGVIVAMSPFNLVQAFYMSENRMRPFILLGRGGQYATLGAVTAVVILGHVPVATGLAVGLSLAFLVGTLVPAAAAGRPPSPGDGPG